MKKKTDDYLWRHMAHLSECRARQLERFAKELVCFIRRKKKRAKPKDATSIRLLSRLL